jgi:3-deoxy-manno-octulosonate cytidylyltransferase (CMP-KDO synthetase)
MSEIIGIIPARYASSRFPGKPLEKILGKTLIQRTYENAARCEILDNLIVATDDQRIFDHVQGFGGKVVMSSPDCLTGTDRLAEVVRNDPSLKNVFIIINIQGDEPCLDPQTIKAVAEALANDPDAAMSTAVIALHTEEETLNPSVVKCVLDQNNYCLYFSRNLIPGGRTLKFQKNATYYKHLGIYGYRREFLLHYAELTPTPLQLAEDLEQLKVLEHGFRIKAAIVFGESMDVNTREDIKKVERLLCKQNTSSSQEESAPH